MKGYSKQVELLNNLLAIAVNVPDKQRQVQKESVSGAYFGMGASNISFVGSENHQLFTDTVKSLYNANSEISETFSIDEFQSNIVELLREFKSAGVKCDLNKYNNFIKKLEDIEIEQQEVFYQIHGLTIDSDMKELGDYVVYKIPESLSHLRTKYPSLDRDSFYERFKESKYWIGLKVNAREGQKAAELTTGSFDAFEHIVNYMRLDSQSKGKLRVFNPIIQDSITVIVCTKQNLASGQTFDNANIVNLDDSIYTSVEFGNDRIWKIATAPKKTEIESRILASVQWMGKGIVDRDPAKSLVQYIFAIEGMFQQAPNTIFTPSILSSVSENLAFLIADDAKGRQEIAESFKEVYRYRSAIAHGGNKTITKDNLKQAHLLASLMVLSFLVKEPYRSMATTKEFNDYIQILKFR